MYALTLIFAFCWTSAIGELTPYYNLENATQYFEEFIAKYDKHYADEQEKEIRFQIFKENLEDANQLNKQSRRSGGPFATFGVTYFMDLTLQEFRNMYTGLAEDYFADGNSKCKVLTDSDIADVNVPDSFDWRDHGAVTRVKIQGPCLSCYAFSTVGTLEGQNAIRHKQLVELSEQQIVDCDKRSHGCQTGFMSNALTSIMEIGGIMTETDYPYTAVDGKCRFDRSKVAVKVNSCLTYQLRSQEKLKQLLYTTGPISIAVSADMFYKYVSGVFPDQVCSLGSVNHAVLLVGYGTDPRQGPYWIVKNSYGSGFGEKGYIRIQRGEHALSCGMMNKYMTSATIE